MAQTTALNNRLQLFGRFIRHTLHYLLKVPKAKTNNAKKLYSKRKSAGQAILDEAQELLGSTTIKVHKELIEGSEAEAILMVAEKQQADLIVIGTRGFGAVKGLLVGSVSRKVIHLSTCPVMVVH